jgi:hypothetical protein
VERTYSGAEGGALDERWDLAEYALSFAADRPEARSQLTARCYGFAVANRHFLLEEGQAAELVSQPIFTPMPNAPEHCLGLANVRGNIIPYYTIRTLLDPEVEQVHETHQYALLLGDVINGLLLAIDGKPMAVARDSLMQNPESLPNLGELPFSIVKHHFAAHAHDWMMLDCQKFAQFLTSIENGLGSADSGLG